MDDVWKFTYSRSYPNKVVANIPIFHSISSFMGFSSFILSLFFLEETYPPLILVAKAAELRRKNKELGNSRQTRGDRGRFQGTGRQERSKTAQDSLH